MLIAEAITIIFLLLKFTSIVSWSWLWIFSPMIIVYGSLVGMFVILGVGFMIILGGIKLMDVYHEWSLKRMRANKK